MWTKTKRRVSDQTAAPARGRTCEGCRCPLTEPGWRACPRCGRELDPCAGCSSCGGCSR